MCCEVWRYRFESIVYHCGLDGIQIVRAEGRGGVGDIISRGAGSLMGERHRLVFISIISSCERDVFCTME